MAYVIEDNAGRPVRAYNDNDELMYCRHYHCHNCGWTVDVDFANYKPNTCPKCDDHRFYEDVYDTLDWELYCKEQAAK